MTVAILCEGTVTLNTDGSPLCDTGFMTVQYENLQFDYSQLMPDQLGLAFGLGFMISVVPIAAAFGFRSLLSLIRN